MGEPYEFPSESDVFNRPTIALTSPNAIPQWKMAAWAGTILALGIIALVAFIPDLNGPSRAEHQFQADLRR